VRIFLASIVWKKDPKRFMENYEEFLRLCAASNLTTLVTIFDRDFPNCACGIPTSSANCTGGCVTPTELFITSGAYKNSTWCPNPGVGVLSLGAETPFVRYFCMKTQHLSRQAADPYENN